MKKASLLLALLLSFLIVGCTKQELRTPSEQGTRPNDGTIPFASVSELRALQASENIVNYEIARKAAVLDMASFFNEFSELGATAPYSLSSEPVVIYEKTGEPKFYEFIVFDSKGVGFATITTFARKEVNTFSACVLPYIREYSLENSQMYSSVYPEIPTKLQLRSVPNSNLLGDTPEILTKNEVSDFWRRIENESDVFDIPDEALLQRSQTSLRSLKNYTIPKFDKDNLKRTRFAGWCGPSAMAWVYRGFFTHYKGDKIPLHGDAFSSYDHAKYSMYRNSDNRNTSYISDECPLIKDIEVKSRTLEGIIKGTTLPDDFDKTVKELFPGFHIDRHKGAIKGAPRRAIQRGNPVYMVVVTGDVQLHYIIGFGTKDKYGWFGIHSDSWILVTDNGTQISKHNYMPYYRSSNFFNYSNKYTHMGEFVQP